MATVKTANHQMILIRINNSNLTRLSGTDLHQNNLWFIKDGPLQAGVNV